MSAPKTDDRPAFREYVREQLAMKEYPRHSAYNALYESIRLGEQLRARGYYEDAADEFEFAAAILRVMHDMNDVLDKGRSLVS